MFIGAGVALDTLVPQAVARKILRIRSFRMGVIIIETVKIECRCEVAKHAGGDVLPEAISSNKQLIVTSDCHALFRRSQRDANYWRQNGISSARTRRYSRE